MNSDTQATICLCARLGKEPSDATAKPLTNSEYKRLAKWLKAQGLRPASLLSGSAAYVCKRFDDKTITGDRLTRLMDRVLSVGIAMAHWESVGLWVLGRSEADYPLLLKRRLGFDSPPLIFGAGDRALLQPGGIAVVGSRKAAPRDLLFAAQVGAVAAGQETVIVSGGAKGVDSAAMNSCLDAGGHSVGFLSHGLMRATLSQVWRPYVMSGQLVLVSAVVPEQGFEKWFALERNHYIYALSDAAIVAASDEKGGTWAGAQANHKKGWVPLYVHEASNVPRGNRRLIDDGLGLPLTSADVANSNNLMERLLQAPSAAKSSEPVGYQMGLFGD